MDGAAEPSLRRCDAAIYPGALVAGDFFIRTWMNSINRSGIYSITNTINGKVYIGSASNIRLRWNFHRSLLGRGKHHSKKLQNSWNKYGDDYFEFKVLLECSVENLLLYEQRAIDSFCAAGELGYNVLPTAGSNYGFKASEDTKKKMSASMAGRKQTPEHTRKAAEAQRGRKLTEEHKEKLSIAKRGKSQPNAVEAMRKANLGSKLSPETIAKRQATRAANRALLNIKGY